MNITLCCKRKKLLIILSSFALLFRVINNNSDLIYSLLNLIDGGNISDFIYDFFVFLCKVLPWSMVLIYVTVLHKKSISEISLKLTYGLITINTFGSLIQFIENYSINIINTVSLILHILIFVLFLILEIKLVKGKDIKKFSVVTVSISLFYTIFSIVLFTVTSTISSPFYIIATILGYLSVILLYSAIIILSFSIQTSKNLTE